MLVLLTYMRDSKLEYLISGKKNCNAKRQEEYNDIYLDSLTKILEAYRIKKLPHATVLFENETT